MRVTANDEPADWANLLVILAALRVECTCIPCIPVWYTSMTGNVTPALLKQILFMDIAAN